MSELIELIKIPWNYFGKIVGSDAIKGLINIVSLLILFFTARLLLKTYKMEKKVSDQNIEMQRIRFNPLIGLFFGRIRKRGNSIDDSFDLEIQLKNYGKTPTANLRISQLVISDFLLEKAPEEFSISVDELRYRNNSLNLPILEQTIKIIFDDISLPRANRKIYFRYIYSYDSRFPINNEIVSTDDSQTFGLRVDTIKTITRDDWTNLDFISVEEESNIISFLQKKLSPYFRKKMLSGAEERKHPRN